MRIVAVSDLHLDAGAADALLEAAEEADLIIAAGDFAQSHRGLDAYMAKLSPVAGKTIAVPGNNETLDALQRATDATILHGDWTTWKGLVVAGLGGGVPPLPPQPWNSWDMDETIAGDLLKTIPAADILVTHSPPYGLGDNHATEGRIGSRAIKSAMLRLKPRLCLFGHVHDCWGDGGVSGRTEWRNLGPRPVWFDA